MIVSISLYFRDVFAQLPCRRGALIRWSFGGRECVCCGGAAEGGESIKAYETGYPIGVFALQYPFALLPVLGLSRGLDV